MRERSTRKDGKNFSPEEILRVWDKADKLSDASNIRLDACRREIHKDKYGDTSSKYGWEIDHIKPVTEGGGDEIDNLQPLHWETNRRKGDRWPVKLDDYC